MRFSVIICYRDREEHLHILAPRLREVFGNDAEIIVVEQDDNDRFLRGQLFNVGAQLAKGEVLIFHDVDHYPVDVNYEPADYSNVSEVILPISRVTFVTNDLQEKPLDQVPSGYRHFKTRVDENFFGGVIAFKHDVFFRINGFNSLYRGWGLEDADIRQRCEHYDLMITRHDGSFYALDHPDSNPGIQDEDFQRNQQLFAQWKDYLEAGVRTQHQTINEVPSPIQEIDRWIKATNFLTTKPSTQHLMSIDALADWYEDTSEKHIEIWQSFKQLVNETPELKQHRDWVIQNNWGYGNRAFHWMWNLIIKEQPRDFKFLEIGVFKGQIISLISLLNLYHKKKGTVFGITPLNNSGDKYSKHPEVDYFACIGEIYRQFGLDASDMRLIEGLSNDPDIIETAKNQGLFDVIYIDGCHDYEVVVSDITNYGQMLKQGGLLVIDDVSNYLNIPDNLIRMNWRGLEDVSNAARDTIEKDEQFVELFAVGHNRVWEKTG